LRTSATVRASTCNPCLSGQGHYIAPTVEVTAKTAAAGPDQPPPADLPPIPPTVLEIGRLHTILTRIWRPIQHHPHWSLWRRRHQARARWYHHRTARNSRYASSSGTPNDTARSPAAVRDRVRRRSTQDIQVPLPHRASAARRHARGQEISREQRVCLACHSKRVLLRALGPRSLWMRHASGRATGAKAAEEQRLHAPLSSWSTR
jgi:hypothetical protein